jgi:Icc-related predicted phosphoesterase
MMQCWQYVHQEELDGALIAGDLGCFPDPSRFDRATKRWIERDPEEAGFSEYFVRPKADIAAIFTGKGQNSQLPSVTCPILFVPGNHEDYSFLNSAKLRPNAPSAPQNTFPVDCYQAIHCIQDGAIAKIRGHDGSAIRIAGLWGIESTTPGQPFRMLDESAKRHIDRGTGTFDLLLTHDVPIDAYPKGGSPLITSVLRSCHPAFHLFGHAHPIEGQHVFHITDIPTECWILEDVAFGKKGDRNLAGSMAILEWKEGKGKVELVKDDWLAQMRIRNWHRVFPKYTVQC